MKRIFSVLLAVIMVAGLCTSMPASADVVKENNFVKSAKTRVVLYGDYNKDGKVGIRDLTRMQRVVTGIEDGANYDLLAGDIDGDGLITMKDAYFVQRWVLNKTTDEAILYGDYDKDGKVGIRDLTRMQRVVTGIEDGANYDLIAGDVDGDGRISVKDCTLLLRWLLGYIDVFPVEK